MEDNVIPKPHDLKKMPLAEVIFELRWVLRPKAAGMQFDPGFRVFFSRYYDRVRKSGFPYLEDLPISQAPEDMAPYIVRHRFRPEENKWPLTQIGPGVLAVNETKGYKWTTFRPLLLDAVDALFSLYPQELAPLSLASVELKYINAIPYDSARDNQLDILRNYLHTNIEVDPLLFKDPWDAGRPEAINLGLTLPLKKLPGTGSLLFATGMSEGNPAIIWEISIRSAGEYAPHQPEKFDNWLTSAHNVADKWFFGLARGDLLKTFE